MRRISWGRFIAALATALVVSVGLWTNLPVVGGGVARHIALIVACSFISSGFGVALVSAGTTNAKGAHRLPRLSLGLTALGCLAFAVRIFMTLSPSPGDSAGDTLAAWLVGIVVVAVISWLALWATAVLATRGGHLRDAVPHDAGPSGHGGPGPDSAPHDGASEHPLPDEYWAPPADSASRSLPSTASGS